MSEKVRRLLESFRPERYELKIEVDPVGMTFAGRVVITGKKVGRPSERLTFHQKDLKITSAEIVRHDKKGDEAIPPARINTHKSFDEVRLHAGRVLYPGNYTVTLNFTSQATSSALQQLYPPGWVPGAPAQRFSIESFVPQALRNLFPSIDEPEAVASLHVSASIPTKPADLPSS